MLINVKVLFVELVYVHMYATYDIRRAIHGSDFCRPSQYFFDTHLNLPVIMCTYTKMYYKYTY